MKLPKEVHGIHKIRDLKICIAWGDELLTFEEIAEKFKLSERRIRQILKTNHVFVTFDKAWEKKKRIKNLQRWAKDAPEPKSDKLALQNELRAEFEGEKGTSIIVGVTVMPVVKIGSEETEFEVGNRVTEHIKHTG